MNPPTGRDPSQDLARSLRWVLDPVGFAADAGLTTLDGWQADLLTTPSHRILGLCSRQVGKTTTVANRVLRRMVVEGGLHLVIAPAERQSGEFFRALMKQYRALDGAPRIVRESALQVELETGGRCVALPGSGETIRSFAAPLSIVIDEAAFVSADIIAAVAPMQATVPNGDFIAISNAGAAAGWFYDQWQLGEGWERFHVTADACPRISAAFLENMRRELGPLAFDREFMCRFTSDDSSIFDAEIIARAFTKEVKPLWT